MPYSTTPRYSRTVNSAPKPKKKSVLRETHKKTAKKTKPVERKLVVLTGKQRTYLRGLAHDLDPILQVGKAGTTAAMLAELDRALDTHELVKVRALRECPDDLTELGKTFETQLKASLVGKLGRIWVLYRRNPQACRIALPQAPKKQKSQLEAPLPIDDGDIDDSELDSDSWEEDEE